MSETAEQGAPSRRGRLALVAVPLIVFAAIAGLFMFALRSGDPSVLPSALVGQKAPEFALEPLAGLIEDGAPVPGLTSADLATGEVTVVNIWASWCVPCRQEHPVLTRMAAEGHRLVGINYKDETENARRFLGTLGNPFSAVGVDPNGRSAIDWGVYGVPETFIVDGAGIIRRKHVGPLSFEAYESSFGPALEALKPK